MRLLETPQSVSVVTRDQMESRQITDLQQALQTVAGDIKLMPGTTSDPNFRRIAVDPVTGAVTGIN